MSITRRRFLTTMIWDILPLVIVLGYLCAVGLAAYLIWSAISGVFQ